MQLGRPSTPSEVQLRRHSAPSEWDDILSPLRCRKVDILLNFNHEVLALHHVLHLNSLNPILLLLRIQEPYCPCPPHPVLLPLIFEAPRPYCPYPTISSIPTAHSYRYPLCPTQNPSSSSVYFNYNLDQTKLLPICPLQDVVAATATQDPAQRVFQTTRLSHQLAPLALWIVWVDTTETQLILTTPPAIMS